MLRSWLALLPVSSRLRAPGATIESRISNGWTGMHTDCKTATRPTSTHPWLNFFSLRSRGSARIEIEPGAADTAVMDNPRATSEVRIQDVSRA